MLKYTKEIPKKKVRKKLRTLSNITSFGKVLNFAKAVNFN